MPARKKTVKKAAKKRISKEAKAFDLALRTPEEATVPKSIETTDENWDADSFDPNAPDNDAKVTLRNGQTATVKELIASETAQIEEIPVAPPEPPAPPAKVQPQKVTQAPPEQPYTLQEASVIIEALIDGLNHLYPFAKRKVKEKDVPILEDRVKRGKLLVAQFKGSKLP
jgi:hypothetical protein